MATGNFLQGAERQGPFESPRFPGWVLHVGPSRFHTQLALVARRRSDGRELRYEEPCDLSDSRDCLRAMEVLSDRLGQEFLDLVPRTECTPLQDNR